MNRLYTFSREIGTAISAWTIGKKLFFWSLLYLCAILYIPNNKALLLSAIAFLFGLIYIFKNIKSALLYSAIFLLPLQSGKGINFVVITPEHGFEKLPFVMTVNMTLTGFLAMTLMYLSIRDYIYNFRYVVISKYALHINDVCMAVFFLANIVSSIISPIPSLSFLLTLQFTQYLYIYYYIKQNRLQEWVAHIMLPMLSSLALFEGFVSVLQVLNKGPLGKLFENSSDPSLSGGFIHRTVEDTSIVRIQGTFTHPNSLGFFIALIAPVLFYYSVSKNISKFERIISSVAFVASITALVLTASRLSWLVTFVEILYIFFKLKEKTALPMLYKGFGIILLLVMPFVVIPRLSQLVITLGSKGGVFFRWNLLLISQQIASENPFGIGLGTFPLIQLERIGEFTSSPTQPHNILAQILVSSGYIGLFSFLLFFYFKRNVFIQYMRLVKEQIFTQRSIFFIPFVAFVIISQFYPILTEQQIIGWLWIFLSIIA